MARQQEARLKIIADEASYVAGVKRAIGATDKFNRSTKRVKRNPFKSVTRSVAGLAGAYIGAQGLISVIQGSVREQQESIKVGRQTNAVLKSTKSAAGLSAKAIGDLAQALSEKTAVDDEAIQSAENLLLTFTKIGKDTFPTATAAVLDLSAATGTSLKGASIQVGKALQDPVKGITALRRVGVNFSADQTEVIKKLVATGKSAEAQKLILKELATEFGGSAAAQATPLDRLRVTYQNLLETLGGYLVPVLNDVANATIRFVEQFRAGVGAGGQFRDTIKGIYDAARPLATFLFNHPQLVAAAAASWVAFKVTLAGLRIADLVLTTVPSIASMNARGKASGAALSKGLRAGILIGLIALVPEISKKLQDMVPQLSRYSGSKGWGNLGNDFAKSISSGFGRGAPGIIGTVSSAIAAARGLAQAGKGGFLADGKALAQSIGRGISSAASSVRSAASSLVNGAKSAVHRQVGAFVSAGGDLVRGLASGIRGAAGAAIQAARDLASSLPGWVKKVLGISSPSKVFAEIGENLVAGMAAGMSKTAALKKAAKKVVKVVHETMTPGLIRELQGVKLNAAGTGAFGLTGSIQDQQELLAAQYAAGNVKMRALIKPKKGKKLTKRQRDVNTATTKANTAAQTKADAALAAVEAKQAAKAARATAGETLKGFIAGILDQIREKKLAEIMAPVNAARAARAARETAVARGGLQAGISRAQAEAADPRVQARFLRNAARLDARIAQARKQGNLEALDALQSEKDALDARYGPKYLAELQDQLAQLNENEIEASSEAAATAFANTFAGGMQRALDAFMAGGTVTAFFASLTAAMQGSGVTPGALPASVTAGVGEAAAVVGGTTPAGAPVAGGGAPSLTLAERIRAQLLKRPKRTKKNPHLISYYAKMFGSSKAAAWAARPKPDLKGHPVANRASGGMLTPGMLTMVGETGPELIVGGKVHSATRTNRMGGGQGMNITVNAVGAAADDPMLLARQLGWQLATR